MPKTKIFASGLHFNVEGHEQATVILKSAFGKATKIIEVHVQGIIALLCIIYHNFPKIHIF